MEKLDRIYGFDDLLRACNTSRTTLKRWQKLYGFPMGVIEAHPYSDIVFLSWSYDEIAKWLVDNHTLVNKAKGKKDAGTISCVR